MVMAESRTDRRFGEMRHQIDDLKDQVFGMWKDDRDRSRAGLQLSFVVSIVSFGLAFVAIGLSTFSIERYSHYGSLLISLGTAIAAGAIGAMTALYIFKDLWW